MNSLVFLINLEDSRVLRKPLHNSRSFRLYSDAKYNYDVAGRDITLFTISLLTYYCIRLEIKGIFARALCKWELHKQGMVMMDVALM